MRYFLFAALALLTACNSQSKDAPAPTSSTQAPIAEMPRATGPADPLCPANGLWAVCTVEKRLKQSGFVAQKNDSIGEMRAGLSVKPTAYTLNKSRLELYLYEDAASAQREISKVDTVAVAPVFIRSGNLIALLFTDDATQAERLSLALTAGAPQK